MAEKLTEKDDDKDDIIVVEDDRNAKRDEFTGVEADEDDRVKRSADDDDDDNKFDQGETATRSGQESHHVPPGKMGKERTAGILPKILGIFRQNGRFDMGKSKQFFRVACLPVFFEHSTF